MILIYHNITFAYQTDLHVSSYLIEHDICYLVLCERNYSKRLAFSYLEEIAQEFYQQYGKRVCNVIAKLKLQAKYLYLRSIKQQNITFMNIHNEGFPSYQNFLLLLLC